MTRHRFLPLLTLAKFSHISIFAHAMSTALPSSRCSSLSRSLEACGATVDGIAIRRYSESERTMVATKDMAEGHVLLRIPIELGVTAQRSTTEYKAARDAHDMSESLGTCDADLLAIWLLCKRAEDDKQEDPHMVSLPTLKEMSHVPALWDEDDVALLEGSEVLTHLTTRKKRESKFFQQLSKASEAFSDIATTMDSWLWAKYNVQTRGFSIANPDLELAAPGTCIGENEEDEDSSNTPSTDSIDADLQQIEPKIPALFPLADMINHEAHADGCSSEWGIERDSGDFLIRTIRNVAVDSELSISYGSLCPSQTLLNYGFVYESLGEHDTEESTAESSDLVVTAESSDLVVIRLSPEIIRSATGNLETRDLLEEVWARDEGNYPNMGWKPMERIVSLGIGTASEAKTVMSFLRVGVATEEELVNLLEHLDEERSIAATMARRPLHWRNERESLRTLENMMEKRLDAFRPAEFGTRNELTFNQKNALSAVQSEKKVLDHWRRLARMAGQALDHNRNSFDFGLQYKDLFSHLLSTHEEIPNDP